MGERKFSVKNVDESITGVALELSPTTEFKKKDERVKLGISAFWKNIEGSAPSVTKLFFYHCYYNFYARSIRLYATCGG